VSHGNSLLLRLDVDVTRTGLDALGEQLIDESDHRGADIGGDTRVVVRDEAEMLHFHGRSELLAARGRVGVPAVDLTGQLVYRGLHPAHAMAGGEAHGALGVEVVRVAGGDDQGAALEPHRQHAVPPRPTLGEERHRVGIHARKIGAGKLGETR